MNSVLNGDIPPGVATVVEAEKYVKIVNIGVQIYDH